MNFQFLKFNNAERGVSLIITFFVLVIVLAVVLSISVILYSELKIIRNIGDSVVAFYAADSGVEKTLYYDRQVWPEGMAGSKRGICNMCNYESCTSKAVVGGDVNGCEDQTCENCEVVFNSDLLGGKTYKVTAKVSQVSSLDDSPLQFSELNINSVGSYNSVFGADPIKRAIEINMQKNTPPPPPDLSVSAAALPPSVFIGEQVTFFALPIPETGDYSYNWTISPSGSCSNGNIDQICEATFASEGTYTGTVTLTSGEQTVSGQADVVVVAPLNSTKAITAFNFNALSPAVIGTINESNHTIALTVPFGTSVTFLVPTITHTGSSINPANGVARNFTNPQTYTVTAADSSTQPYIVTVTITPWVCGSLLTDTRDSKTYATVLIGTQCWMAADLNVGTKITSCTNGYAGECATGGDTVQNQTGYSGTTCGSIQKYCYSDTEANCDAYGGLYQWNQTMCGSTTVGVQGICPTGWHIPTDTEQYNLENYLKDSGQTCVAARDGYDCSTAGTKLKSGGTSGFNGLLAGGRLINGSFFFVSSDAYFWSSLHLQASSSAAWIRTLSSSGVTVGRFPLNNAEGLSVRCLKN